MDPPAPPHTRTHTGLQSGVNFPQSAAPSPVIEVQREGRRKGWDLGDRMTCQKRNLSSVGGGALTCGDPWNTVMAVYCRAYQNYKVAKLKNNNGWKQRKPTSTLKVNAMSRLAKCHTLRNAVRMGGTNRIQRQMLAICAWKSLENKTQSTAVDSACRE